MNTLLYVVIFCAILVFFRQEINRLIQRLDRIIYLNIFIILALISFLNLKYYIEVHRFLHILNYNIANLSQKFYHFLGFMHLNIHNQMIMVYLFRWVICLLFLFYPRYYQQKYPSQVYATQVFTVKIVCYVSLTLLMMLFAVTNL